MCQECNNVFRYSRSLKRHITEIHGEGKRQFKCNLCEKQFSRREYLAKHILTHTGEKIYTCPICSTTFGPPADLRIHLQGHRKCQPCPKKHQDSSNLKLHNLIRSGAKKHKSDTQNINANSNTSHIVQARDLKTETQKNYRCKFCGKWFNDLRDLTIHTSVHTNGKPLKCHYCEKEFSDSKRLGIHIKVHTTDRKRYKCNFCLKQVSSFRNLVRHTSVHTNERAYKCQHCEKEYKHPHNLKKHMKIFHRKNAPMSQVKKIMI